MIEDPTQRTAREFVSIIPQVVRLLCLLAADGISIGDSHPGNFGSFGDRDIRVIDWADARFSEKPKDLWQIWRLVSKGFGKFKSSTTEKPNLRTGVQVRPSWRPLLSNLNRALVAWQTMHHPDPLNGLQHLSDQLNTSALPVLKDLPAGDLFESVTNSSAASTSVTPGAKSVDRRPHVVSDGAASVAVRGTMPNSVAEPVFRNLRAKFAGASLYTGRPNKRYSQHKEGRSGSAEVPRDVYFKIHAVSVFVWHYIQQQPFCDRFSAQPPPKAYSEIGEFQQWLFKKMKTELQSVGTHYLTDNAYWTHIMKILRQGWESSDGRGPQCNWPGWFFKEEEFTQLQFVLRHAFSAGFGVLPQTQCPRA
jgi:hypothetical protein